MTQITDEISRAASLAYVQTKGVKEVDGEAMMNALTAALPLIRDAVLDEVALKCQSDMVLLEVVEPPETKLAYGRRVIAHLVQTIRDMKEKQS